MKLKKGYKLYEVQKGKIHIQRNIGYICGLSWSSWDKLKQNNRVIESDIVICKKCLKKYYKEK